MQDELLDGFRLKDKRIEPLTGFVRGPDSDTRLPTESAEVLLCLARRPRQLVSCRELLGHVWGDGDRSPEPLERAVEEIRQALGDSGTAPAYIQTVPRRGYRLLVEPEPARSGPPARDDVASPGVSLISALLKRGVIQAATAFLVVGWLLIQVADAVVPIVGLPSWIRPLVTWVVIGGLPLVILLAWFFEYAGGRFYLDRGREPPNGKTGLEQNYLSAIVAYVISLVAALVFQWSVGFDVPDEAESPAVTVAASRLPPDVQPNSIAVLRFGNDDGSALGETFSNGLAEDVLDRLARIPGLLVSSRRDSWSISPAATSTEIRRRLRVGYYLDGEVRIDGDDLAVTVSLFDSGTGFLVGRREFERQIADFMEVQEEITDLTVASLRLALPEDTQTLLAGTYGDTDVDAYVLYRRARELLDQPITPALLAEAEALNRQALDIDPQYAAAYAGLCSTYVVSYESTRDASFIEKAERACSAGLDANSYLHMVYSALGDLYTQTGSLREAEVAYRQALEINPQDAQAMQGLAVVYEVSQRLDEAIRLLDESIRLQPGNWRSIDTLGGLLFANGQYADAVDAYRRVVSLDPSNYQGQGNLGSALLMTGDFEAAAAALEESLALHPDKGFYSNLAIIYYYLGSFDESVRIHRMGIEDSPDQHYVWLNLGDALTFSGNPDQAGDAFRRSAELAEALLSVNPRDAAVMYELAWANAMLGNLGYARQLIDRSLSLDPENPYAHYYNGLISVREERDEQAIAALGKTIELGYPRALIRAEPYLAGLRSHREFAAILASKD